MLCGRKRVPKLTPSSSTKSHSICKFASGCLASGRTPGEPYARRGTPATVASPAARRSHAVLVHESTASGHTFLGASRAAWHPCARKKNNRAASELSPSHRHNFVDACSCLQVSDNQTPNLSLEWYPFKKYKAILASLNREQLRTPKSTHGGVLKRAPASHKKYGKLMLFWGESPCNYLKHFFALHLRTSFVLPYALRGSGHYHVWIFSVFD